MIVDCHTHVWESPQQVGLPPLGSEDAVHTLPQCADGGLDRAEAGHHQYSDIGLGALRARDHIEAIDLRHTDINQQQVNTLVLEMLNRDTRIS